MAKTIKFEGKEVDAEALLRALDGADCQQSLYTFLQYAWRLIDPSQFVPGWPLEAICEHLQAVCDGDIRRLVINIPPRCGKPVRADTLVSTKELGLIELRDVRVGMSVLTHRGRFREVEEVHLQGLLPTVKITTRHGRELFAAPDHPVLTANGWVNAGDLRANDVVAVVPQHEPSGIPSISEEEARLLGYLIGDGACYGTPNITVADDIEAADIKFVIERLGMAHSERCYLTKVGGVLRRINIKRLPGSPARPLRGRTGPVNIFMDKHGIYKKSSYTKRVPDAVMRGSNDVVRNFLGAYWSCDGHISMCSTKIGCDSVSKELMTQIQALLLRLGINSTVRIKRIKIKTARQGDVYTSYRLMISDADNCWRFATRIPLHHSKAARLDAISRRRSDFDRPLIPDDVTSVEADAEAECICLTVADDHSFVANGIAVHNSSILSVAYPAWTWAQRFMSSTSGPGTQFLYASYAGSLAIRDSVKCRRLIESPWYQSIWGDRYKLTTDQNTKTRFDNDKQGSRLTTSVGAALTGEGGNCFPAGTMVSTPSGRRPIERLRDGDAVFAFDHSRGMVVKSRVIASRARVANDICEIHAISGHRTRCTPDHPIFVEGRGYIRADRLGPTDRIYVEGGASNCAEPDLRRMRSANHEATLRGSEGAAAGQSRCLLQQEVLLRASCNKEFPSVMRRLWLRTGGSTLEILLAGMSAICALLQAQKDRLSDLPSRVCWVYDILLPRMRWGGPFGGDVWQPQPAIQGQWPIQHSVQKNWRGCEGARSFQMRELRVPREDGYGRSPAEVNHPYPSRRRGSDEPCDGEPDLSLQQLPHAMPRWVATGIASVARYGAQQVDVHDIQVEGQSNFFADGILVHNCIIVDDPNAAQDAYSEATIKSTIEWWDTALSTRLNDPKTGAFIVIQQRLSEEDLTGHILEHDEGDWTTLVLPMRYEPERTFFNAIGWTDPRTEAGELLWPARFPEEQVRQLERQLGPSATSGQLQQRPEPLGGGIIKRDWWQTWEAKHYPPMEFIIASLDTAYTTKTENDFSAISIWGVFSGDSMATSVKNAVGGTVSRSYAAGAPRVMLMNAWQERLELHELVKKVAKTCLDMRIDKLIIENKAAGHSVAQELRRLFGGDGFGVQLIDPGGQDKLARLYSVQHLFAEGMIYAPDKQWADMVITQVGLFPRGKHDDVVDTVSQSLRHLRDLGMLTRAPEMIAEIEASMVFTGRAPPPLYDV